MSRNTDAVTAIYESFGEGDVPAILARLAPEVVWEHDRGAETRKWFDQRRGRDAVPGFFASLADFEFVRFEPFAFLDGGNMVAVPVRLELVHKANGKRIGDLEMHLWTFGPDGLVTGFRHFVDTHQWAKATVPQTRPRRAAASKRVAHAAIDASRTHRLRRARAGRRRRQSSWMRESALLQHPRARLDKGAFSRRSSSPLWCVDVCHSADDRDKVGRAAAALSGSWLRRPGDPTVDELREGLAALLGKEAALRFPGGTMCNFVAVKAHAAGTQCALSGGRSPPLTAARLAA